jgi:ABC-type antimicrobial peptide transport system permease subunit
VGYLLALLQIGWGFEFRLLLDASCATAFLTGAPLATGAGTLLTVLAAGYPTYIAARMKPVDAMRVEV